MALRATAATATATAPHRNPRSADCGRLRWEPRRAGGVAAGSAAHPCADDPARTSLSAPATPPAHRVFVGLSGHVSALHVCRSRFIGDPTPSARTTPWRSNAPVAHEDGLLREARRLPIGGCVSVSGRRGGGASGRPRTPYPGTTPSRRSGRVRSAEDQARSRARSPGMRPRSRSKKRAAIIRRGHFRGARGVGVDAGIRCVRYRACRCAAIRAQVATATSRLDGSASPWPARSSAVPWSTATRG